MESDSYSQGVEINASDVADYTAKSEPISECNKLSKLLNGGLLVTLQIDKNATIENIKKSIEEDV